MSSRYGGGGGSSQGWGRGGFSSSKWVPTGSSERNSMAVRGEDDWGQGDRLEDDTRERGARAPWAEGHGRVTEPVSGFKFLAAEGLVSAIIGKGGTLIAEMRSACKAQIAITGRGEVYAGTTCRVVTVHAATREAVEKVIGMVLLRVEEFARPPSLDGECPGSAEHLEFMLLMPREAVSALIGKGATRIKELRERTGATITIGDTTEPSPHADQLVSVVGSRSMLEQVVTEISKHLDAVTVLPWFSKWLWTTHTYAADGGYGGGWGQEEAWNREDGSYGSHGPYGPPRNPVEHLVQVAQTLPPYVLTESRGFALDCVLPSRLVGGLIGRYGSGTKEIGNTTGTVIRIRDIHDDPDHRTLNITGPLPSVCAAYMLMMKRYLDVEAQMSNLQ